MLNQRSLERWAHENSARYCMAPVGSSIPLPDNWPGAVVKDAECNDPTAAIKKLKQSAQEAHSRLGIYGDTKREQADGARLEAEVAAGREPGLLYCKDLPVGVYGTAMIMSSLEGTLQVLLTDETGRVLTPDEAIIKLAKMLMAGMEYVPICSHTMPTGQCMGHKDPKEVDFELRLGKEIKDAFFKLGDGVTAWTRERVMDWLTKTRAEIIKRGLKE